MKILRGEPGLGPTAPPSGPLERPPTLDDAADAEWDWTVAQFAALRVLTAADAPALYCEIAARRRRARAELGGKLTATTAKGNVKGHPAVGIVERCEAMMARLLLEFGGVPAPRARLKVGEAAPADRLVAYLDRKDRARKRLRG